MRFYTKQHAHYCGIDLHARTMYLCILDGDGGVVLHQNVQSSPAAFLQAIGPYRENLVVAVECIFTRYWLADLCQREEIDFVLGHALYMRAIHGGKAKNGGVRHWDDSVIPTQYWHGLLIQLMRRYDPSSNSSRMSRSRICVGRSHLAVILHFAQDQLICDTGKLH